MDNDSVAVALAITIIDEITNSVVVVGGNTAHATALNVAPTEQTNNVTATGDAEGAGVQTNISVSDNDASAKAIAATFINVAHDSVIVFADNVASAGAVNLSPVVQSNTFVAALDDASGGGLGDLYDAQAPTVPDVPPAIAALLGLGVAGPQGVSDTPVVVPLELSQALSDWLGDDGAELPLAG
ncbi:hypothetical protein [Acuticoccus sp.]|uniref:hypothetical protein n=1 Tax=Acuticoccus sp. TaxID=1904378 RepID=UPI003B518487